MDRLIDDVAATLRLATSSVDACRRCLDVISRIDGAMGQVMLPVRDYLRCVAATSTWQVYSAAPPGAGVVGRVYSSGRAEIVTEIDCDPDYIPLGPTSVVEVCVPVVGPEGQTVGALNLEWTTKIDADTWCDAAAEIGRLLGTRITALSGPPAESLSEKVLRHALAFATAGSEEELLVHSLYAAREVSGLDTPIIVLNLPDQIEVNVDHDHPTLTSLKVSALDPEELRQFIVRAGRYGASYSLGDPDHSDAAGFEVLTGLGVRTLIAIPVGVKRDSTTIGGVLLCADEEVYHPDAELVNLLSLLAAQAWSSLERLQTLRDLRDLAISDPLTGLRHHGSFTERLANAMPGHTAVLTVDIDGFKAINDTYGHQAGDRILVDLAQALSSALRSGDELYRVGGDEFAAVVEVQRPDEAVGVANRLVAASRTIGQTISVGVAIRNAGETADQTLSRADAALYVAKRAGRDGVRLAA